MCFAGVPLVGILANAGLRIHLSAMMSARFDSLEASVDARFDRMDSRFDRLMGRLIEIDHRLSRIADRLGVKH